MKKKNWIARTYQKFCIKIGIKQSLALFLDPGLGKTTILLAIYCWLKKYKKSKGVLVLAPLNPLYLTWPDEIKQWLQFSHLNYTILHKKPDKHLLYNKRNIDVYLANPESLTWIMPWLDKTPVDKWPVDVLIVDESSAFKNTKSKRTRRLMKLAKKFKRRYIANGTPTGNGYLGLFSQMFLVDLGKSLGSKKGDYLANYFKLVGNPLWYNYQLKNKNTYKEILKAIKSSTICLEANDHIKIPKEIIQPKYITLPASALRTYQDIESDLFAEIDSNTFVAETSSTMANMLHQICNGNLYYTPDPLSSYVPAIKRGFTQLHKEKLYAIEEIIEEVQGKQILIAYKFKHDEKVLQAHFGKKIVFFTSDKNKKVIQQKWNSNKIQILAGQYKALGFGLNLQKSHANIVVPYSIISDFEVFDQFIRRLRRSGNQKAVVYVYPILAKGLYDDKVTYKVLQQKGLSHKSTFDYLKDYKKSRSGI